MLDWLFGKTKVAGDISLDRIRIDIHSHLIPGIDDGAQTLEESVEMVRKMRDLGYSHLVTTPHVIWDCYRNTPSIILDGVEKLREAVANEQIDINIQAAAEYFIDEHFMEMLRNGEQLLTLPGKRLLVELPYSTPLLNTIESMFFIIENGYQPVLAHPERYTYFYADPSIFKKFVDHGCELQVNALSLGSYYGPNVNKMAQWLLENRLISYLGSDAHKIGHLNMITKADKNGWLSKYPFQNENLVDV